jgi:membrane-associated protein
VTVGMSTMAYRRFIAWTLPACILWSFAYVTAGSLAAGSYRELSDSLHFAGYIFVAAIVVFVIVVLIVKKLIARGEERHMNDASDSPDAPAGRDALPR